MMAYTADSQVDQKALAERDRWVFNLDREW